jgi:hypothetical protein
VVGFIIGILRDKYCKDGPGAPDPALTRIRQRRQDHSGPLH